MVPEWVLDADIGDCALRLYAVLLRYGNSSGARMPARATLAARLHKKSVDTVDRALAELVRSAPSRSSTAGPANNGSPTSTEFAPPDPATMGRHRPRPQFPVSGVAARMRLPAQIEPGVAAAIGAGWPHRCGMTENPLPKHHHPLHPRQRLGHHDRAAQAVEEVEVSRDDSPSVYARLGTGHARQMRSSTGTDATSTCSPTTASPPPPAGTPSSPRYIRPGEGLGNRSPDGRQRTC